MSTPVSPSQVRTYQTVRPPPTELVALAYFTPLIAPTPCGTRVPKPSNTADTINGFLRVEAGGGVLRSDGILWDVSCILHAYANNTDEAMAEQLGEEAVAWGANFTGSSVKMPNGDVWYCTYARCSGWNQRKGDPLVPMTRYRSMVTWRMPGLPIIPGQRFKRIVTPEQITAQNVVAQGAAAPPGPLPHNPPRPSRRRS
ncbi:MAG TPA: hypothetical protein VMS84_07585 [Mycobacterium sp.]|jgi:hypothetical protein|nr:hypothetical protein [Mycobacterium sp.]